MMTPGVRSGGRVVLPVSSLSFSQFPVWRVAKWTRLSRRGACSDHRKTKISAAMSPSNSSKEEAKAKAADLIRTWCWEKGMEMFADHPLKLLDSEYLRTWGGLKHILFPDGDDLGLKGEIPANHWHYRFYHGVACVLGWTECVTVGDLRYWGEEPHRAIKELWPDRPFPETTSARRSGGLTRW